MVHLLLWLAIQRNLYLDESYLTEIRTDFAMMGPRNRLKRILRVATFGLWELVPYWNIVCYVRAETHMRPVAGVQHKERDWAMLSWPTSQQSMVFSMFCGHLKTRISRMLRTEWILWMICTSSMRSCEPRTLSASKSSLMCVLPKYLILEYCRMHACA